MRRGEIVLCTAPGDLTSKRRPCLVVQRDLADDEHPTLTLCPLTSRLVGFGGVRVPIPSDVETGLTVASEVAVDLVTTQFRRRLGPVIGRVPADVMTRVDDALRRWLGL